MQRRDNARFPHHIAARNRQAYRLQLHHVAQALDLLQIVQRNRHHPEPLRVNRLDQAGGRQPRQRLAQRRGAEAKALTQALDAQLGAGGQLARQASILVVARGARWR